MLNISAAALLLSYLAFARGQEPSPLSVLIEPEKSALRAVQSSTTEKNGRITLTDFFANGSKPSSIQVQFFSDEDLTTFVKESETVNGDEYYWYGEGTHGSTLNLLVKTETEGLNFIG